MPTTTFSVPNRTNIHLTWLLLVSSLIWTGTGTETGTGHGVAPGSVVGLDGLGSLWCLCCGVVWCGHFLIWFRYLLSHTFYYLIYQSSCWMPNAGEEGEDNVFLVFCMPNVNVGGSWQRLVPPSRPSSSCLMHLVIVLSKNVAWKKLKLTWITITEVPGDFLIKTADLQAKFLAIF